MRTAALLLAIVCLLGVVTAAAAMPGSWHGPWPDSMLLEWTADSAMVPGETALMSPETWLWSPYPEQAPDVYWLRVYVAGKFSPELTASLINVDGYYLIPVGDLSRIGLAARLDAADMVTINISGKGHSVRTRLGARTATVDGFNQLVPVPARWQRGMVYVSLGMLNKVFGLGVKAPAGGPLTIGAAAPAGGTATPPE